VAAALGYLARETGQGPGDPLGIAAILALCFAALALLLRRRAGRADWIVVDGSNVLHWDGEVPALATVAAVVADLAGRGFVPVVWFDANVGYKVGTRYMGPGALARALGVSERQVYVAPKGTPADPLLLEDAAALGARVVSNDRFRDWTVAHPILRAPDLLVRGRVRRGAVELDLPDAVATAA
jgi:hypothetical protein